MDTGQHFPWIVDGMFCLLFNPLLKPWYPPSMLITLNKPFHLTTSQAFISRFQHLKPFTGRGLVALIAPNMHRLPLLFVPHARRSMNTMIRLQHLLHISCQWVWILSLNVKNTKILLVLNPEEKMKYFKKHWSVELQKDVANCVEEVVGASSVFLVLLLIYFSLKSDGYYWAVVLQQGHPRNQKRAID